MANRSEQLVSILEEVKSNLIPGVDEREWAQICDTGIQLFGEKYTFGVDITRRRDTVCTEVSEALGRIFNEQEIKLNINNCLRIMLN